MDKTKTDYRRRRTLGVLGFLGSVYAGWLAVYADWTAERSFQRRALAALFGDGMNVDTLVAFTRAFLGILSATGFLWLGNLVGRWLERREDNREIESLKSENKKIAATLERFQENAIRTQQSMDALTVERDALLGERDQLSRELAEVNQSRAAPPTTLTPEGVRRLAELMALGDDAIGHAIALFDEVVLPASTKAVPESDEGALAFRLYLGYVRENEREAVSRVGAAWDRAISTAGIDPDDAQLSFERLYYAYHRLRSKLKMSAVILGPAAFNHRGVAGRWYERDEALADEITKMLRAADMESLRENIRLFHAQHGRALFEVDPGTQLVRAL